MKQGKHILCLALAALLLLSLAGAAPAAFASGEKSLTLRIPAGYAVWPGEAEDRFPEPAEPEQTESAKALAGRFLEALLRYASGYSFDEGYPLSQMVEPGSEAEGRLNDLRATYGFCRCSGIKLLACKPLRCAALGEGRLLADYSYRVESVGMQGKVREEYRMRLVLCESEGAWKVESFWPSSPERELAAAGGTESGGVIEYRDEDGDGLILVPVSGSGFNGYLLAVLNPMRVVLGFSPEDVFGRGYTVAEFAEKFGAVAAINGGGFQDTDGMGDGSAPERLVVQDGTMYLGGLGIGGGFTGLDDKGVLHVGLTHPDQIAERNIQHGCSYGPVLIENGAVCEGLDSHNLNPRTAIAQREDGTLLLLVVEGRRGTSLGATYQDLAVLLEAFGAVTADNLDGGYSSLLWMDGDYVNNRSFVTEIRPIPTAFLVMPK